MVKLALKILENLFDRPTFRSFFEKLESWLELLNTPMELAKHRHEYKPKVPETIELAQNRLGLTIPKTSL